ncbi:MAG: hypothetical protein EON93_09625 [Burkholderiales bacterium]|nr:MAG: hypothetical protein EON93_09625 [Burkholderiales bacterium]
MKVLKFIALAAVALTAPMGAAHAQFNQPAGGGAMPMTSGASQNMGDRASNYDTNRMESELSGAYAQVLDRRGRKLNNGQVMNAAKAAATASGLSCNVTEAALRGVTPDNNDLWEVACQSGPGYMITSPNKSTPFDCTVLAAQAEQAKADGVALPATATCSLKGNKSAAVNYVSLASSAGIPCTVDGGATLGVNAYEIGCANSDGYIIEQKDGGWSKVACWRRAASTDGACKLSTAAESNAAWKTILAGTDAASCNVEKSRQIGIDGQKRIIYEVKCTGAPGYLARVNADAKAEMLHACADPATAGIGGGCKLATP